MAEFTKGIENLQDAITSCEQANSAMMDVAEAAAAKTAMEQLLSDLHGVSDKFFLKTMMSVPPTKACRVEAAAVALKVDEQDWAGVATAIEKLQKVTKALVTKAKMDGTTIT